MKISASEAKEVFRYEPETGLIFWRVDVGTRGKSGSVVGSLFKGKYWRIGYRNNRYFSHRLAFLIVEGRWPVGIDHINGNGLDNRWINLREADQLVNQKNTKIRMDNKTGVMGVRWRDEHQKWESYVRVNNKRIHLGSFDLKEDATKARDKAEKKYGFHANHGRLA